MRKMRIGKIRGIALVCLMIGATFAWLSLLVGEAEASPTTMFMPDDYATIQAAVATAN